MAGFGSAPNPHARPGEGDRQQLQPSGWIRCAEHGGRAAREQRYIGGVFGLLVLTSLIGFRR
jgi:hypothetical protein